VLGLTPFRGGAIKLAAGVYEPPGRLGLLVSRRVSIWLEGVKEVATCIALANFELAT
jgi:hypothetical protein